MKGWGVWWLDGVDVSVMVWCQTLCHCQCQPRQPISQWPASPVCFKAIVLLPLPSVCWCCCVFSLFPPLSNHFLIGHWLWGWCGCRAAISPMFCHPQHCVSCHAMRHSSESWLKQYAFKESTIDGM